MEEDFERKDCIEATIEDGQGEDVQVFYLSVPETGESQVLDISNLLVQEGIQIVETQVNDEASEEITAQTLSGGVLLSENGTLTDQTTAQSAHALLKLSKSHGRSPTCGQIKVVDVLDANIKSEEVPVLESDSVELTATAGTATYIVDENGTMIPLGQYRPTGDTSYVQVEEAGVSTIAICTCWCGKEFISQDDLDKHKLIHDKPRTRGTAQLKCELCPEVFPSQSKLANHHRVIHPDGMPWECPICFRRFSKKLGLKVHLRAHSGLKQHKCTFCDRSFSYKNALLRHMKLHTKDKPYKCSICGEGFTHLWAMRRHRATHKPANLYQCDICSKTFKQKQTLFIHARIHTGHKPYSCEICRKSFTLKSSLNQHLRIHTGERPKICPLCNKAFRQTSTLKSHMKLHTHMKPHKCRYCKTRFSAQEEMLEHELVHLKNKSWHCEECGMRFRNQSLLSRHVRKHTNERPFQCKICGKSFSQSGSLQSHMRTHTKEKPYQCRLCPKTYTTSGTLLIHIRRAHGLEAKKVKDVFPSTNYIEDQKIFTIRSHAPVNRDNISSSSAPSNDDSEIKAEVSTDSTVIAKDGILLEDLVGSSEDIISQDGNVLIQRINLDAKGCDIQSPDQPHEVEANQSADNEIQSNEEDEDDLKTESHSQASRKKTDLESSSQGVGYSTVKELMTKRQIKPCSLTLMNIDGFSRYKVIDMENEKENSLYAQARQEAALGLAELSLVGGIVVSEKRAGTTSRTVAREVEDNRTEDPNVTKIILSKEGGVMNSQDPHQCPECKRIFGRKSIMVEHRRIHTDEKPYECDFCFVRFRQSAQLSSHIRNKHTKERKYQCSFCQNRFLSRSITIRHINFHHKLKVRLCESINPNWTVDEAISCDDKYQVVVKDEPNIMDEEPVNVIAITAVNAVDSSEVSEANDLDTTADVKSEKLENLDSDLKEVKSNVSTFGSSKVTLTDLSESGNFPEGQGKVTTAKGDDQSDEDSDIKLIKEALLETSNIENIVMKVEQENVDADATDGEIFEMKSSPSEGGELMDDKSQLSGELAKIEDIQDANFGESRLVCETCAMQFRGISSLRWHLKKVHQTTLAESDVSYIYEDQDPEEKAKGSINYPVENDGEEHGGTTHTKVQGREQNKDFEGDLCAFPLNNKNSVAKSSLKCCICCVCFGSRIDLEEHLKSHENEEVEAAGMHRCDTCGLVMKNTQQISKHILKMHGVENVYGCSICDKEFLQESSVLRHMKFFHKWEMKIRGEGNIPVLLKPAPASLSASGSLESGKGKDKGRKDNSSKRPRKSGLKVSSREENNVTFISLEVGDLDSLQLYRDDGKKVKFEVVKSTDEMTTIRIKDFQSDENVKTEKEETSSLPIASNLAQSDSVDDSFEIDEITNNIKIGQHFQDHLESNKTQSNQSNAISILNDNTVTTLVVKPEALKAITDSTHELLIPNPSLGNPDSSGSLPLLTGDRRDSVENDTNSSQIEMSLVTQAIPEHLEVDMESECTAALHSSHAVCQEPLSSESIQYDDDDQKQKEKVVSDGDKLIPPEHPEENMELQGMSASNVTRQEPLLSESIQFGDDQKQKDKAVSDSDKLIPPERHEEIVELEGTSASDLTTQEPLLSEPVQHDNDQKQKDKAVSDGDKITTPENPEEDVIESESTTAPHPSNMTYEELLSSESIQYDDDQEQRDKAVPDTDKLTDQNVPSQKPKGRTESLLDKAHKVKTISVLDKSLLKEGMNTASGALLKATSRPAEKGNTRSSGANQESLLLSKRASQLLSPGLEHEEKSPVKSRSSKKTKLKGKQDPLAQEEFSSSSEKGESSPKRKISSSSKKEVKESIRQQERRSSSGRLIKRKRFSDEEQ